jgi:single-strand DNA-binding protein
MGQCVNKVILLGYVGNNPEIKQTSNGSSYATFRMATNENSKNKSGERVSRTEWHNIVLWNKVAEIYAPSIEKGRFLYIEGKVQTRKYEKNNEDRYFTEIVANSIKFLTNKKRDYAEKSNENDEEYIYDDGDDDEMEFDKKPVSSAF